jgi:hypothetical protein
MLNELRVSNGLNNKSGKRQVEILQNGGYENLV